MNLLSLLAREIDLQSNERFVLFEDLLVVWRSGPEGLRWDEITPTCARHCWIPHENLPFSGYAPATVRKSEDGRLLQFLASRGYLENSKLSNL